MSSAVTFTAIKSHIGSLVQVDKAKLCDPAVVQTIRNELEQRGVLVFPRLDLSDAQQLAFTDAFGQRLNYAPGTQAPDGEGDDIYKISLEPGASTLPDPAFVYATWFWHMDGVVVDQPLPKATMLSARHLSPTGGQTEFANTFSAWELLPQNKRRELLRLKVVHRLEAAMRCVFPRITDEMTARFNTMPPMVLPLVWTQPDGRRSLVLGSHADEIVGMSLTAGRSQLARLMEWAAQPELTYTHEWELGDFVIWNNHGVMHRVVPYAEDSGRNMHRTSITGDQKLGRPLTAEAA
jgi:alpha-ketoglutarate-dependent taurine dioxygenase